MLVPDCGQFPEKILSAENEFFLHENMKMDKFAVRQDMKFRRDAMSLDDVLNLSRAIEDRLFACKEFSVCQHVMFYLSLGNEVRTDEMITRSLENHQRVYVPRLVKRERRLEVCRSEERRVGKECRSRSSPDH